MTDIKFEIVKTRINASIHTLKTAWTTYEPLELARWKKYHHDKFAAYKIYDSAVWNWIEEQPIHMWKYDDENGDCYLFTEEMEAWFLLRWS